MGEVIWLPHDGWPRVLADFLWQSTLIGCLGWLAALALHKRPAAKAHVCIVALALCLLVPLATLVVRNAGWGLLPADPAEEWNASYPFLAEPGIGQQPLSALAAPSSARLPGPWAELAWCILRVVWYLVTACLVLRLMMSVCSLVRLLRGRTPCRAPIVNAAARVAARQIGLRGRVEVAHGDAVASPTVWACGRSTTIILPPAACGQAHDWLSVFCHELAHARRGDPWCRLLAEFAATVLPWQPFVWLLRRHYQQASEEACDDWAVALGCEPDDLADTLVNWLPSQGAASLAPSLRSKVIERVRRLLSMKGSPKPELGRRWRASTMVAAGLLACLLALAQARPPRAHWEALSDGGMPQQTAREGDARQALPSQAAAFARERRAGVRGASTRRFSSAIPTTTRLNGCSQHILRLLALEQVRRDLGLSSAVYLALQGETERSLAELEQRLRSAPDRRKHQDWWNWIREIGTLNRNVLQRVEARLSLSQIERLQQIVLQSYGAAALLDPRVAGRLAMSPQQFRELRAIYAETSTRLRELYAQVEEAGLEQEEAQACATELRQQRDQRLLGVLTPSQRDAFDRMTGQKLKIDAASLYRSTRGEARG